MEARQLIDSRDFSATVRKKKRPGRSTRSAVLCDFELVDCRPARLKATGRKSSKFRLCWSAPRSAIKTVNLKSDMPQVYEALQRMDRELALARQEKAKLMKLVHGYGSTGAGGDIRIAVQKRLLEMADNGQIRGCIFGENWSKSDETAWKLLQSHSDLKSDSDLGRGNRGITIVLL